MCSFFQLLTYWSFCLLVYPHCAACMHMHIILYVYVQTAQQQQQNSWSSTCKHMFSNHARGNFWKVQVHQGFPVEVTTKRCFRFSPYQVRLWLWPEQHLHVDARQDGLLWLGSAPPGDQLHQHGTQLWPHTAEQQWWEMPIAIHAYGLRQICF